MICVAACRLAAPDAEVLTLCTAMPKLPDTEAVHPGGAGADGEIIAVTACGAGTGFALTMAARARTASEYCMSAAVLVLKTKICLCS